MTVEHAPLWSNAETDSERHTTGEPEFTGHVQDLWREMIWRRTGLYFSGSRLRFLRQRLWERMRLRGYTSYGDYYHFVRSGNNGQGEFAELLEILVNSETSFFRHAGSFDALTKQLLPELMRAKQFRSIRMWSAGCSKGQEAYSMAMAFLEMPESHSWQLEVIGSDISRRCLERARRGRYRSFEARQLPEKYQKKYVPIIEEAGEQYYQVSDKLKRLVEFKRFNMADLDRCPINDLDVIFCQNVLLYFRPDSRVEVARRLCQRLLPGGYLLLAPAEVVGLEIEGIEPVKAKDALVYRRIA